MKKDIHYEFIATAGKDGHYECLYEPISFQSETTSKSELIEKERQTIKEYMNQYSDVNKLFFEVYYRNFQTESYRKPERYHQEMIDIQNMILNKLKF